MAEKIGKHTHRPRHPLRSAIVAGTLLLTGCSAGTNVNRSDVTEVTSTTILPPDNRYSESEWSQLTAQNRIIALENNDQSKLTEEESRSEMVSAVSTYYSDTLKTIQTPEQLAAAVHFISSDEMVNVMVMNTSRQLSDQEKEAIKREQIEAVVKGTEQNGTKQMFINLDALNWKADTMAVNPEFNKDKRSTFLRFVLLHAFGHVVQEHEPVDVTGQILYYDANLNAMVAVPAVNITDLEYKFPSENGGELVGLDGLDEAMPHLIASQLNYSIDQTRFQLAPEYDISSAVLAALHEVSGISNEELYDYLQGKRPFYEYLDRISVASVNKVTPRSGALWSLLLLGEYFTGTENMLKVEPNGEIVRDTQTLVEQIEDPNFGGITLPEEYKKLIL